MLHFKCQWILRGVQSLHPIPVQSASGVQVSHVTTNVQVYTSGVQVSHVTTNVQVYTSGSTMTFHMVASGTTTTVSSVHFRFQFEGIRIHFRFLYSGSTSQEQLLTVAAYTEQACLKLQ